MALLFVIVKLGEKPEKHDYAENWWPTSEPITLAVQPDWTPLFAGINTSCWPPTKANKNKGLMISTTC